MEQKKSVGIWIRVSTEDQVKGESPEHHEKRARMYAEAKGWHVETVYHLEAVSGKAVMKHPETTRMMREIKNGTVTGIIFSKLARLARNTKELLEFADYFKDNNADLISLQESIDTSTPAGRLFYTIMAATAQWEREEIVSRVTASIPIRAKLGKTLGGQASFGYKWEDKRLVVDTKEAPIRRLMYDLFLKYKRKKTTASELNKMGYRTRNGSKFSSTTIDRLLRDPTAKGEQRLNYTKMQDGKRNWVLKPKEEWVIIPCPAVVTREIWEQCNVILDEQASKYKKLGPRAVHLLAGFLHCHCGKKMYVFHENNIYACKSCKNRIAVTDIDEIYHDQLKTFLLTDMDVSDYLSQSEGVIKDKEKLLSETQAEMAKLKKKMDTFVELRVNKELTPEQFKVYFYPIEEQYSQLGEQIPELQAEIDFMRIQYLSSDSVLQEAKDLYERWPKLGFEEKRSIVEVITEKIVIGKEDISISLAYLPSSASLQNTGKGSRDYRDSYWPPT